MNPGENEINYNSDSSVDPKSPVVTTSAANPSNAQDSEREIITWQASEFVDHQKSASWSIIFVAASIIGCGLAYLLIRSWFSVVAIATALAAFMVVAIKKPRTLTYSLLGSTLRVGDKNFRYDDFRSFSLVRDGALWSIVLNPLKRFMPALTIYFAQEDGEKIFDVLASHLPQEDHQMDSVDRLMRKIRF